MTKQKGTAEWEILRQVTVRLIVPEERARFDQLLETRHYLQSARLGGQSLRYVAEVDGEWVALITFSGASPHTKAREQKIRWTPRQRARRLCFVVNNSRFLVLPERQRYPNLASRVLRLWPFQPGLLPGAWPAQAALSSGTAPSGDGHTASGAPGSRSGRA